MRVILIAMICSHFFDYVPSLDADQMKKVLGKCKEITSEIKHDKCIIEISDKYQDIGFCDELKDKELYELCWRRVIDGVSSYKADSPPFYTLCGSISKAIDKDNCFLKVAYEKYEGKQYCSNILDPTIKEDCFSIVQPEGGVVGWRVSFESWRVNKFKERKDYASAITYLNRLIHEQEFYGRGNGYLSVGPYYGLRADIYELSGEVEMAVKDMRKYISLIKTAMETMTEEGRQAWQKKMFELEQHIHRLNSDEINP